LTPAKVLCRLLILWFRPRCAVAQEVEFEQSPTDKLLGGLLFHFCGFATEDDLAALSQENLLLFAEVLAFDFIW
jgi:hypothetical protein